MPDKFSKETRSFIMSRIRDKDTKPELILRKYIFQMGLRYNTHTLLPGKPDIVFPKKKVVVFVDGDFWHGYNWKELGKVPPKKYWQAKIQRNIDRDKKYTTDLKNKGWTVLRFWEHEVIKDVEKCYKRIQKALDRARSQ